MTRALLLVALAAPGFGQLSVATVDARGAETLIGGFLDLGTAAPHDLLDTRFRLRNLGAAALPLGALEVSGVAFSILGEPSLPYLMAPGTNVDFRVRFRPTAPGSYSTTLRANDRTVLLRAVTPPAATLLLQTDSGWSVPDPARPVDFGRIEASSATERRFLARNESAVPVTIEGITVTGTAFSGPDGVQLPARLEPGAEVEFTVRFAPSRAGPHAGSLQIDSRVVAIEGAASEIPFPDAEITVSPAMLESGRQAKVSVRLAEPSRAGGSGTLTLRFAPSVAVTDDPALMFVPSGTRTVSLVIQSGANTLTWQGFSEVTFQTGTTAGAVTLDLVLGGQRKTVAHEIAPAPVRLDAVRLDAASGGVEVSLAGLDNTRSASALSFQFRDRADRPLTSEPIRADVTAAFAQHFRGSIVGGLFALRAVFPVTGDVSQIGGVEVELRNSAGAAAGRAEAGAR